MNKDEYETIHRWAMDSGLADVLFYKVKNKEGKNVVHDRFENLKAFAWHVAQHEREACAKLCEDSVEYAGDTLAQAIRARGQA